jgi:hypothetical protein
VSGSKNASGVALWCARIADDVKDGGRIGEVQRRPRSAQDLEDRFPSSGTNASTYASALRSPPPVAALGDDEAAVGVGRPGRRTACSLGEERGDAQAGNAQRRHKRSTGL